MISGRVTYERYIPTPQGLDYENPQILPARQIAVSIYGDNDDEDPLFTALTDDNGQYSISNVPFFTSGTILALASLGGNHNASVTVYDNTQPGFFHGYGGDLRVERGDLNIDFEIPGGWNQLENRYDEELRNSGPWAILDDILEAQNFIRQVDQNIFFPHLIVYWSPANSFENGSFDEGAVGGTYYDPTTRSMVLVGSQDDDTDEFDRHIVIHEYAHYLEDVLSRSDSLGGFHGFKDILDETVAFSEGWANAFSAMVLDDPLYIDTGGVGQANAQNIFNMDFDDVPDSEASELGDLRLVDGPWSEASIEELIYDLYDGGSADDDNIQLGFKTLWLAFYQWSACYPCFYLGFKLS